MTEPERDADLIDRLYAGAADQELEGLRMVRGLVARVRDEMPGVEPPQVITARLLQAAVPPRAVAAVEPARPGFWDRMRRFFAQPAVAAMAMLVLVAGAAALWMRQGKPASPAISTTGVDDESKEEAAADVAAETRGTTATLPPRPPRKPAPPPPERVDEVVPAQPSVTTHVGGDSSPQSAQPAPPPPPTDSNAPAPAVHGDTDRARQLTQQAVVAAKKGDCAAVEKIAKKVKDLDAEYYAASFVPQDDIRNCRVVSY